MAGVSLRRAFASGFLLIGRRPLTVFAWGAVLLLFVQAPMLFLLSRYAPDFLSILSRFGSTTPQAMNEFNLDLQQRMIPLQAMTLPTYIVHVVIVAAVYRAVLEPSRDAFASLRIGRQEGWLLLLTFAFMALVYLALIPLYLVIIGGVLGAVFLVSPFNLIGPVVIAVALLAAIWAVARLGMAAPMTFSDRRFRLFESWSATRGQGLRLVGLGLLIFLFSLVVELVLVGLVLAAVLAIVGHWPTSAHQVGVWLVALRDLDLRQAAVWLVPLAVAAAAIYGSTSAIVIAPWASFYQQLNAHPNAGA